MAGMDRELFLTSFNSICVPPFVSDGGKPVDIEERPDPRHVWCPEPRFIYVARIWANIPDSRHWSLCPCA